jgi:probable F420-dependent oxidoreductase
MEVWGGAIPDVLTRAIGTRRWGLAIPLPGVLLANHGPFVRQAEARGYTDAWSGEVDGLDGFSPLIVAALHSRDMMLGTGIVNVFTRGPATLAQSAVALADIAPGRFALGLGSGSQRIVEDWNGATFTRPVERVRDVVEVVRLMLTGERVDVCTPSVAVHGFRLSHPLLHRIPLLIAALRPGMLRLAGAIADGVVLNLVAASDVPTCLAAVREGAATPGRTSPDSFDVVCRVPIVVGQDRERLELLVRRWLAAYINVPVYRAFHAWLGHDDKFADVWGAWDAGFRDRAATLIPASALSQLFEFGDAAAAHRRVDAYVAAGITVPVIQLFLDLENPDQATVATAIEELGP